MQRTFMMTCSMILASSLVGLITGFTIPLISLTMASKGITPLLLGFLAALPAAGMLISSFITPWLSIKVKFINIIFTALFSLTAGTVASCLIENLYILSAFRLITGIASGTLVILGESWITGNSSLRYRAAVTGIYTSTFTGFQLVGPLLVNADKELLSYILLSLITISSITFFLANRSRLEMRIAGGPKTSWRGLLSLLPVLSSGVFCFSFFDASILSFLPLYSLEKGTTEELSLLLISVILIGDAVFQVPIGYLADKFGARRLHRILGVSFCLTTLLFPFFFTYKTLLLAGCVLLGAVAGGLYTLSLVRAGALLQGQRLIVMNAILNLVWAAGSISGPVLSGLVITHFSYKGFTGILFVIGLLFLLFQFNAVKLNENKFRHHVS
ncbi:MFS transporter [Enterobacteriaceae bacterium 8376wB9]|nr:MFS transporter [Enterobacteriaceae bacterium 8376wB9]